MYITLYYENKAEMIFPSKFDLLKALIKQGEES